MSRGHGIIINQSSKVPFIFTFNPVTVEIDKKINYVSIPNIGGSYKKKYFIGFDSKTVSFEIHLLDKKNPMGVHNEIAFFEQLRSPDAGFFGIAALSNQNYPPPQVLFQFGVSYIPLVWDVLNIDIRVDKFKSSGDSGNTSNAGDIATEIIGVPKQAVIGITLGLDEDNAIYKANAVAEKVAAMQGVVESGIKEALHHAMGTRKESSLPNPNGVL